MVMVIDQAIDNFKADTGQSIPVPLVAAPAIVH